MVLGLGLVANVGGMYDTRRHLGLQAVSYQPAEAICCQVVIRQRGKALGPEPLLFNRLPPDWFQAHSFWP